MYAVLREFCGRRTSFPTHERSRLLSLMPPVIHIFIKPFNARHILSERPQDIFIISLNMILSYHGRIYTSSQKRFIFYPVVREWLYCKKKEGKKQLLSSTTVKTRERPGKIKKCICEDVYIRPMNHYFWTYIYVHGIERVKETQWRDIKQPLKKVMKLKLSVNKKVENGLLKIQK